MNNRLKIQTNIMPAELTSLEFNEMARAIALYHKGGKYTCQTFFTPPRIGEMNWVEGFESAADVYFRSIRLIGTNLFHVLLIGKEADVRKVCMDSGFFKLLAGIHTTFTEETRMRWYLDTTKAREHWDVIASFDKKKFFLANYVELEKKRTHLDNVIVVGDQLIGLTDEQKVVSGQLTPDILEKEGMMLPVTWMDEANKLGKVDLLTPVPNSENSFMLSVKNMIYQFSVRGEMLHFETLEDRVKRINFIDFNNVRTLLATNDGLYEIDVKELPNMVRPASLPRQISHPDLRENITVGRYVEDPFILGVHPAVGIVAKTESEKVLCF